MVTLLSNDMKALHRIKQQRDVSIATGLAASAVLGYGLGTALARRIPFGSTRTFSMLRMGIISALSFVRLPRQHPPQSYSIDLSQCIF
jgi:hypothetical protein